jgi:nucleoside-diphosphate-sugar epimerase
MTYPSRNSILVTGATGNVGRNVISLLSGSGAIVRALTRTPGTETCRSRSKSSLAIYRSPPR